jgi:hypothetical protein
MRRQIQKGLTGLPKAQSRRPDDSNHVIEAVFSAYYRLAKTDSQSSGSCGDPGRIVILVWHIAMPVARSTALCGGTVASLSLRGFVVTQGEYGLDQTSRHAIQRLLQEPSSPSVTGVYRSLAKVPAEFKTHPNFQAVQGDLTDGATLDFRGSDAVITLTPPKLDGSDFIAFGKVVSQNVRDVVQRSGTVKRIVCVSSMGAQYSHGYVIIIL